MIIKPIAFLSCCRRGRSFLSSLLRQVSSVVGLVQLHLNQVNNSNRRDSRKTAAIFKNSVTFLILANMFRRYIRHHQCDGYGSL